MARLRTIKPGFFTNDDLGECSPFARLLFAGLWTIADREGRMLDRPKKIKAEVLPYDDVDPDELLNDLAVRGFILRYQAGSERCIQIVNWTRHQTPHIKEAPSTIQAPGKNGAAPEPEPDEPSPKPALAPPCLGTSSGDLEVGSGKVRGAPPAAAERSPSPPAPIGKKRDDRPYSEAFEAFWAAYPRKIEKHGAWIEYRRCVSRGVPDENLAAAARHLAEYVELEGTEDRYVPHASTFLGPQRKFESFIAGVPAGRSVKPGQNGKGPREVPDSWHTMRALREKNQRARSQPIAALEGA